MSQTKTNRRYIKFRLLFIGQVGRYKSHTALGGQPIAELRTIVSFVIVAQHNDPL